MSRLVFQRLMMKWLGALLLLLSFASLHAETALEQVKKMVGHQTSGEGAFIQRKKLTGFDGELLSSGRFQFSEEKGILWKVESPISSELRLTRDSLTTSNGDQLIMALRADEQPVVKMLAELFYAVLGAQWQLLERHFTVEAKIMDKHWQMGLTPRNDIVAKVAEYIKLQGDSQVRQITLSEQSGDRTHIEFSIEP